MLVSCALPVPSCEAATVRESGSSVFCNPGSACSFPRSIQQGPRNSCIPSKKSNRQHGCCRSRSRHGGRMSGVCVSHCKHPLGILRISDPTLSLRDKAQAYTLSAERRAPRLSVGSSFTARHRQAHGARSAEPFGNTRLR